MPPLTRDGEIQLTRPETSGISSDSVFGATVPWEWTASCTDRGCTSMTRTVVATGSGTLGSSWGLVASSVTAPNMQASRMAPGTTNLRIMMR